MKAELINMVDDIHTLKDKLQRALWNKWHPNKEYNSYYFMPSLLNDIIVEFVGVSDNKFPPYHFCESSIGNQYKWWAGVSGCSPSLVDNTGGCGSISGTSENLLFKIIKLNKHLES